MAFIKRKSVLIILYVLIGTLIFSAFSLAVFNIFEKSKDEEKTNLQVAAAYDFSQGVLSGVGDSNYGNEEFSISSPIELINFSNSVKNGCHFKTKRVYLNNDIDMSGYNWQPIGADMDEDVLNTADTHYPFLGKFDGCGCTISDLTTTINDSPRGIYFYLGFFACVKDGAEISNLRIKNFTINLNKNRGYAHTGAIVGYAISEEGACKISDCVVDGFTVNSVVKSSYHSGLVGYADSGTTAVHTYKLQMNNIMLKNFICNGTDSIVEGTCYSSLYELNTFVIQNSAGEINSYATNTNKFNESTKRFETNDSIRGSEGGSGGTAWYCVSDYNGGYPYLRQFLTWRELKFSADSRFELNIKSIELPSDYSDFEKYNQSTSASIIFGDKTITATPISSYYNFIRWKYSSYTYLVEGNETNFTITLKYNNLATLTTMSSSLETHVEDVVITSTGGNFVEFILQLKAVSIRTLNNPRYAAIEGYIIDYITVNGTQYDSNCSVPLVENITVEVYIVEQTWNTIFK